jgi:hypothetical protein
MFSIRRVENVGAPAIVGREGEREKKKLETLWRSECKLCTSAIE